MRARKIIKNSRKNSEKQISRVSIIL